MFCHNISTQHMSLHQPHSIAVRIYIGTIDQLITPQSNPELIANHSSKSHFEHISSYTNIHTYQTLGCNTQMTKKS